MKRRSFFSSLAGAAVAAPVVAKAVEATPSPIEHHLVYEITAANAADAIYKLVAARTLPALRAEMAMASLVNRSYDPI